MGESQGPPPSGPTRCVGAKWGAQRAHAASLGEHARLFVLYLLIVLAGPCAGAARTRAERLARKLEPLFLLLF
jgi:hypothetical protein